MAHGRAAELNMPYRILVILSIVLAACNCCGQDINRSKEWTIKRAEQSEAKVEAEMMKNGVYAPKGGIPKVVDERGFATTRKKAEQREVSDDTEATVDASKESVLEATAKNQFSAASEVLVSDSKEEQKPFQVLSILALVAGFLIIGFKLLTRKIEVPEGALNNR
jgi:hypothetical protein